MANLVDRMAGSSGSSKKRVNLVDRSALVPTGLPQNPGVRSLLGTVTGQLNALKQLGGQAPKASIGAASRVLDLFSRPQYAIMAAIKKGYEAEHGLGGYQNNGDWSPAVFKAMAHGFGSGLAGTEKTGFADVLAATAKTPTSDRGILNYVLPKPLVRNRVARGVLGFAGDIAADPTTYATLGISGAVKPFEKTAEGLRAIDELKNVGRVGEEAARGVETGQRAIGTGYKALNSGQKTEVLRDVAEEAVKAGEKPGTLTMKFAGRNVPLGPVGRGAYTAGTTARAGALKFVPAEDLAKLMSLGHNLVGDTKNLFREANARNAFYAAQKEEQIKKIFKGLSPDDKEILKNYRMNRRPGVPDAELVGKTTDGRNLQDVANEMDNVWTNFDRVEMMSGRSRPTHSVNNDIPHYFFTGDEYGSKAYKKFMKDNEKHIDETGFGYSLNDASRMYGLHPEQDLEKIMLQRARQAHGVAAQAQFKADVLKQYGRMFTGEGSQAAERAAVDRGAELVDDRLLRNTPFAGQRWYTDPQIHKAMKYAQEMYDNPNRAKGFWQFFDRTQRSWKTLQTTYNPSHHINNLFGDAFLNWISGNQNPLTYVEGNRIRTRAPGGMKLNGKMVSNDTLRNKFIEHGGVSGFTRSELRDPMRFIQPGEGKIETKIRGAAKQAGEKVQGARDLGSSINEKIYKFADTREEFGRMSNFAHQVRQWAEAHPKADFGDPKVVNEATQWATRKMRESMLDYGNLTNFERQVMQRAMPFYNFTRQSMPQMAKMMLLHPDMVSRIPKLTNNLSVLMGADPGTLPLTEIIPEYIRNNIGIRAQGEGSQTLLGRIGNTMNPLQLDISRQMPFIESMNALNGLIPGTGGLSNDFILKNVINRLSPVFRAPSEAAYGKSSLTGQPINKPISRILAGDIAPTWAETLPGSLTGAPGIGRLWGPGQTDPDKARSQRLKLINLLSPGQIREINPNASKGELRRIQDPIQARLQIRRERARTKAAQQRR